MNGGKDFAARQALRGALEVRRLAGVAHSEPVCVYDLAERLGLGVQFKGGSSFGGLYVKSSETILVPALRPPGRQAFTCAHELGHWYFGHGSHIDELTDTERFNNADPKEYLANLFAGYFLMTPWAVKETFTKRHWSFTTCTPIQVYIVAVQLGVGYETLIQHLRWSLKLISSSQAESLLKVKPIEIRNSILKNYPTRYLVVADLNWTTVSIDLQVDDIAIVPQNIVLEGKSATIIGEHEMGTVLKGDFRGISRIESYDGSWAAFVRVAPKDFIGINAYRHLEDPDDNETTEINK